MKMLSALWPPFGVITVLSWSQVLPLFQVMLLVATICTVWFYNFVESPWYMNLLIFWMSIVIALGAILVYIAISKEEPSC